MSMNVTASYTLTIPNGEVFEVKDSKGTVLWKKDRKYTISFNANGGSGTMADQEFTFGELQALSANKFTKSGSTFYGWSTTPDGMAQYIDGQSILGIGNYEQHVTLYAVWAVALNTQFVYTSDQTFIVPITGTYSIELHGGGGGGGGGAKALADMHSAYASGGAGGGSGALYTATLTKGTSYALTIGTGGSGGSSKSAGSSTSIFQSNATGSTGGTGGTTKFGSLYSVEGGTGGTGGTAKASEVSSSKSNGSTGTAKGNLASGSSGGATTGTYGNGGSGGSSNPSSGSAGQNGAIIIKLTAYSPYTVVFDANSGSGSMTNQSINVNEATPLSTNTLTRSGYNFLGWSTTSDGDVVYTDGESVTNIASSGETITLYAVWDLILAVGTTYTYTSNTTFTVPKTGTYSIEMHGGGGGGGGGAYAKSYSALKNTSAYGGDGGGSGEIYTATLTKGTSYALTIGTGGSGGSGNSDEAQMAAEATGSTGGSGGTTKFGSLYSIAGGTGGTGGYARAYNSSSYSNGSTGTAKGSLASGSSGGATTGTYGNGGSGGASGGGYGSSGQNGVIIIKYLG